MQPKAKPLFTVALTFLVSGATLPGQLRRNLSSEHNHQLFDHEAGQRPELVAVGECFFLFPLGRTDVQILVYPETYPGVPRFTSHIELETGELFTPLPFELTTIATWKDRTEAFAPFTPDLGYHVSRDDFDTTTRLEKLVEMTVDGTADIPGNPLELAAFIPREAALRRGLHEPHPDEDYTWYTKEALEVVSRLRLQLSFPSGMRLESRPDDHRLYSGDVNFMDGFYPFDTGPLPAPKGYEQLLTEGLQVAVPADLSQLSQIEVRFVIR